MRAILLALCALFGAVHVGRGAEPPAVRDFTAASDGQQLRDAPKGVAIAESADGGRCLAVAGSVGGYDLVTLAVQPETKYRINLRARIDGERTVEQNDRAHIDAVQRSGRCEAGYQVVFFDDSTNVEGWVQNGGFILTAAWHDYVHVFHTPPNVRRVCIRLLPRKHDTCVERVSLEPDDEGGTVNANPDFRYGELNYCGWRPQRDGRIYRRPDGSCVFRSGYGGASPPFPLRAGLPYRLAATGDGGHMNLDYSDAQGKIIASRFLLRPTPEGVSVELTPPDGTVSGRVVLYGVLLNTFTVLPGK